MSRIRLIATAAFGLEAVVARELEALGYTDRAVEDGRIAFEADAPAIARTNLWLRSADRVMLEVGSFEATDFGTLFDRTREFPWHEWLPENAAFPIRGKAVRSQLMSVRDCQSLVKKAIVGRMQQAYGREWFDEDGPTFPVEVSVLRDRVTLAIDTSGAGLHKRGYRTSVGEAPIKETLAAALVQLSYWNRDRPLIDPFCGTGTIAIEAAMIGRRIAPGRSRNFVSEEWPWLAPQTWQHAREEAKTMALADLGSRIVATDIDKRALGQARHHARQAGVETDIHFQQQDVAELATPHRFGCLITNPPYGERLAEAGKLEALYETLAAEIRELDTWSSYVITAYSDLERKVGRRATRQRKLYNGKIECTYYQFVGPRPESSAKRKVQSAKSDEK